MALRQLVQRPPRLGGFVLFFLGKQADRVNQRIALIGSRHYFFQRDIAGVIVAVGYDQQDLLVFLGVFCACNRETC